MTRSATVRRRAAATTTASTSTPSHTRTSPAVGALHTPHHTTQHHRPLLSPSLSQQRALSCVSRSLTSSPLSLLCHAASICQLLSSCTATGATANGQWQQLRTAPAPVPCSVLKSNTGYTCTGPQISTSNQGFSDCQAACCADSDCQYFNSIDPPNSQRHPRSQLTAHSSQLTALHCTAPSSHHSPPLSLTLTLCPLLLLCGADTPTCQLLLGCTGKVVSSYGLWEQLRVPPLATPVPAGGA